MFSAETLDNLADFKVAGIIVPVSGGEALSLDCLVRARRPSHLEVRFLAGQIPPEGLDAGGLCQLSCELGLKVLSVRGVIAELLDEGRLLLEVEDSTEKEDPRRHMRVDAEVTLRYWPALGRQTGQPVVEKVNISGGGIRFPMTTPLKQGQKVRLELILPGPGGQTVDCVGQVVDVEGGEASLKIVRIEKDRLGALLAFCASAKLLQMRGKVEFLGEVLRPR